MSLIHRSLDEDGNGQSHGCSSYLVTFLQAAGDNREYCESVADAYFGVGCLHTSDNSQNDCCNIFKSQYDISCRDKGYFDSSNLLIVVLVLLLCAIVTSLIEKNHLHWLPEAGGCIIVGAVIGGILQALPSVDVDKFEFDQDFFLSILLPPIIFDAALSVSKTEFRKRKFPIIMFAVIGTILSTFFTGYLVHYGSWISSASTIPVLDSLVFGALISSIDPVAILSVLSSLNMGQNDTIFILIFGESLLNDGVAITMFHALVGEYQEGSLVIGLHTILNILFQSLVVGFGSIFIGTLSEFFASLIFIFSKEFLLLPLRSSVSSYGLSFLTTWLMLSISLVLLPLWPWVFSWICILQIPSVMYPVRIWMQVFLFKNPYLSIVWRVQEGQRQII
jgi:NhaP-type Na+/H+ and K+/H+ antiporters